MKTSSVDSAPLERLLALEEIRGRLHDYIRGMDRLLPDVHLSAFHSDAWFDCGIFAGRAPDIVPAVQSYLAGTAWTHHMLGQTDIRFDDDGAGGEIYYTARHREDIDGVPTDLLIVGRYVDRYTCVDGQWKIAHRVDVMDVVRSEPPADHWLDGKPDILRGARGDARPEASYCRAGDSTGPDGGR